MTDNCKPHDTSEHGCCCHSSSEHHHDCCSSESNSHCGCGCEHAETHTWQPIVSGLLLAVALLFDHFELPFFQTPWLRLLWYIVAFLPVGYGVVKGACMQAWKENDYFTELTLMSVAAIGAFCLGEYAEGVAVMWLYSIGEHLQDLAVDKAKDHIKSLVDLKPDVVRCKRNGQYQDLKPEDVAVGDEIEVRVGERVPLDGCLQTEQVQLDTAALTGESMPREMQKGEEVLSGMVVMNTTILLKVTKPLHQSALQRILDMVEEAQARKSPTERFIRRFARVYTPIVVVLAFLVVCLPWLYSLFATDFDYHFATWINRALVFLVISCPCALVLSVPLSYFAGIGVASRRGILFKGGNYLEAIAKIKAVVFDKTGTLTTGAFAVTRTEGLDEKALHVVASIEQHSSHPIAQAIVQKYGGEAIDKVQHRAGYGLEAQVNEETWLVGALRMLEEASISYPHELKTVSETLVCVARNGIFVGYILLSDQLKEDAKTAVDALRQAGVAEIAIFSGDKQALVSSVGNTLGVDKALGDLLPQDKGTQLEHIQTKHQVAFVGDGINDAPVLAMSDVGIAMGTMGTDAAIETADVVLRTDQPSKVAEAIRLGKRTHNIVWQNIIFALSAKVFFMVLGVMDLANLWVAVFADTGVALLTVLNAMRMMWTDKREM